jgi:ABC-2 type transport system permease protein
VHFYTVLFRKTYLQNFQYRIAALINNFGSLIFGFMYIAIWQGTLGPDRNVIGFGSQEMGWYMALVQGLLFITTFLPRGFQMDEGVRTGAISLQMMRPVSFYGYHLVQCLGFQAYNLLFRSIPVYIIMSLFVGFPATFEAAHLPLFVLALLFSAYLGFLMNYFVGITAFWTNSIRWAFLVQFMLITTFSGFLVPLPILPGWLAQISEYSPYAGMNYYPAMILLDRPSLEGILVPLVWCVILTFTALAVTRAARRKLEVQGG